MCTSPTFSPRPGAARASTCAGGPQGAAAGGGGRGLQLRAPAPREPSTPPPPTPARTPAPNPFLRRGAEAGPALPASSEVDSGDGPLKRDSPTE